MLTPYQKALAIVEAAGRDAPLGTETVPLRDAIGRVLAEAPLSRVDNPPFDSTSMDGFAVRAADLTGASLDAPVALPLAGLRAAGHGGGGALAAGSCLEVMTGGPVPAGTDAFVPVELIRRDGDAIVFTATPVPGMFLRPQGSDLARGAVLLPAGTRIAPPHLLPLAAGGAHAPTVRRRPRVALLSTGPELVADLSSDLAPGQIYNASQTYAAAVLTAAGAEIVLAETLPDDEAALADGIARARAAGAELIVSTGGVSAGKYDFIPPVLRAAGAEILFHKLALRPGKPQLFARFDDGTVALGLPGNPISTAVGLRFLALPHLAARLGIALPAPRLLPLAAAQAGNDTLALLLKSRIETGPDGRETVRVLGGQESYRVAPLAELNAWVHIEPGASHAAGDLVPCHIPDPLP